MRLCADAGIGANGRPPVTLRGRVLSWAAAGLLWPAWAQGQVGGSIGVDSDYRFRGVSLSGEKPDLRLSLSFDHDSGPYALYAGLTATGVELERDKRLASLQGYAGISGGAGDGWRWEAGATATRALGDSRYDYAEAYAGLLGEAWSLRLYFAPDYFGSGRRTAYAEFETGWALAAAWRLAAHGGVLQQQRAGRRVDLRLGVVYQAAAGVALQLAWVAASEGDGTVPGLYEQRRSAVLLGAAYAF